MGKFLVVALVAAASLAGCGSGRVARALDLAERPEGVNCSAGGGTIIVRQGAGGQKGYCLLPDGRALDLWAYFRETHP